MSLGGALHQHGAKKTFVFAKNIFRMHEVDIDSVYCGAIKRGDIFLVKNEGADKVKRAWI